ncbi:MAG: hypothetical protein LBP56_07095 [Odoribacteraceae bacterium]|jgi:hypothetical protein|nr:hypothetical protein [Odoribacteraceae bacterium]
MKKIISIGVFTLLGCLASTRPSFSQGLQLTSNQQLIEEAVKEGILLVRQSYQIKDTSTRPPTYYRWGNRPHMGSLSTMGIKSVNGIYARLSMATPWNVDPRYEQYRSVTNYVPVISGTEYRTKDSTRFTALSSPLSTYSVTPDSLFVCFPDNLSGSRGFPVDTMTGNKAGWLVWLISEGAQPSIDTCPLSLLIYRHELLFEAGNDRYEIRTPATTKEIIGGVYLVPTVTAVGQLTFHLAGLTAKIEEKWHVIRIGQRPAVLALPTPSVEGLTPVVDPPAEDAAPAPTTRRRRR